jgi:hypothetical protein
MTFHPLPKELKLSDYTWPQVDIDSSRWELEHGQQISTRLHNTIDAIEGHTYYRWYICNKTCHDMKTYHLQQCMYDKNKYKLKYIMICFVRILNLSDLTFNTGTLT